MHRLCLAIAALVLLPTGCATDGQVPARSFPSQAELDAIERAPLQKPPVTKGTPMPDSWEWAGPLPDELGATAHEPQGPWERELAKLVDATDADDLRVTAGMDCAAREIGRFYQERGRMPTGVLRDVIRSRCGVAATEIELRTLDVDGADAPVAAADYIGPDNQIIASGLKGENRSVGVWASSSESRTIAVFAFAKPTVELEPTALYVPESGTIDLRGEFRREVDDYRGFVTSGPFDAETCRKVKGVEPPAFHIRCPMDAASRRTAVRLKVRRPDGGSPEVALANFFWKHGNARTEYRPSRLSRVIDEAFQAFAADQSDDAADLTDQLHHVFNAIRREAGLSPVALDSAQSKEVDELGPRFMALRRRGGPTEELARIGEGLKAGWRVDGKVLGAEFEVETAPQTRPARLLRRRLTWPEGRYELLDPAVDRIASSVFETPDAGTISMVTLLYRTIDEDESQQARIDRFVANINAIRQQRGLPALDRDESLRAEAREVARQLTAGEISIAEAEVSFGDRAAATWNTDVGHKRLVTSDLEDPTPWDLLLQPDLPAMSFMIVPHRSDGAARWHFDVVMAYR